MNRLVLALAFVSVSCFGQDLIVTNITPATAFGANDIFWGTVTIKNTGIVPASSSQIFTSVYFSSDNILDNSDLNVGYASAYTVNAGETKTLPIWGGGQIKLPAGTYYLIAAADNNHSVAETDESNNELVVSGYALGASKFDFTISSINWDKNVDHYTYPLDTNNLYLHDNFSPQLAIANPGNYSAGNRLTADFYLSTDQTFDNTDVPIGRWTNNLNSLEAMPWIPRPWPGYPSPNPNIPFFPEIPAVPIGQYYVITVVDPEDEYVETDESNNTFVSKQVDIVNSDIEISVANLSVGFSGDANSYTIDVNLDAENSGTTGAANVPYILYLSTDAVLDNSDQPLFDLQQSGPNPYTPLPSFGWMPGYFWPTPSLPPNHYMASLWGNSPITPGTYYVILLADPGNALDETNVDDNIVVSSNTIIITAPPPPAPSSAAIQSASFMGKYDNTDTALDLSFLLKNIGTSSFSDLVPYKLTIKDSNNSVKHSSTLSPYFIADAGQSSLVTSTINLSAPLPLGDYSATLDCVDATKCNADSYSFTLKIDQVIHTLSGTIKGEDGTILTSGKLFLYQKNDAGNVKFTQKIVPVTSSNFTFQLDNHQHTLYFIPDVTTSPQFVPTIFGKTVVLGPTNFFSITKDSTVVFEILKVQPLAPGPQTISGNVVTGSGSVSSGRTSAQFNTSTDKSLVSAASIPVLLLNDKGVVVGFTQTDASGNYMFSHLPAAKYQVLITFELDQPSLMKTPIPVDVTTTSKEVNLNFSTGGSPATVIKSLQSISFSAIAPVTYAHDPISIGASASSSLPLNYSSSNPSVATVTNGQITIAGVGTTNITASQPGDDNYKAAANVVQTLTVSKAELTLTSDYKTKWYGEPNPPLTFSISGLKSGETLATSGATAPTLRADATQTSDAGSYSIQVIGGNGGSNYLLRSVTGILTIKKLDQAITFDSVLPDLTTNPGPVTLHAVSSLGLPVTFKITEGTDVVTQNASVLTLTGKSGKVIVEAQQSGDKNHNAAIPVSKTFKVELITAIEPGVALSVNPNPTKGWVSISSGETIMSLTLFDVLGKEVEYRTLNKSEYQFDLSDLPSGTYVLNIVTASQQVKSFRIALVK